MQNFLFFVALATPTVLGLATPVVQDADLIARQGGPACSFVPTNPRGPKVVCNKSGTLKNPHPLGTPTAVSSVSECRGRCFRNGGRVSFGFTVSNGSNFCQLYDRTILKQGFKRAQSGPTVFYNRRCFKKECDVEVPPTCGNQGIQWARYFNEAGDNVDDNYTSFDPEVYKTAEVRDQNQTPKIGGFDYNPDLITIYNDPTLFDSRYFVLNHRAFFFPTVTGIHTITITDPDDIAIFWIGSKAYSGWTRDNADLVVEIEPGEVTKQYDFYMVAGSYYPFRVVYANAQNLAVLYVKITDPNQKVVLDAESPPSDQVVQYSCDETSAPRYPAFGTEE